MLKRNGIIRKGKLEFVEKNKKEKKIEVVELTPELEEELRLYEERIKELLKSDHVPGVLGKPKCKKCAYYEYCYIE